MSFPQFAVASAVDAHSYSRAARSSSSMPSVACFAVTADADPGILSRVVEPVAKRGLVVDRLTAVRDGGERDPVLHIDLQVSGLDDNARAVVAAVLDQTVGVRLVLSCEKESGGLS